MTAIGGREEAGVSRPLAGRLVCLVFEHSLSHYSRILLEIDGLRQAGARVLLVTEHPDDAPSGTEVVYRPLGPGRRTLSFGEVAQTSRWLRSRRVARKVSHGLIRRALRPVNDLRYRRVLRTLAREIDIFWVVDFPKLASVIDAATEHTAVVYETVDLVPEYLYRGPRHREMALQSERRLIPRVDGFITACASYADYYMERYADVLARRPVVRDNMPARVAHGVAPTRHPVRLLFLGSLLADRPVRELVEAVALSSTDVTLTFQGKNHLRADEIRTLAGFVSAHGLHDRVQFLDPVPGDRLVDVASAYDVGVVPLRGVDENERRASTGKLFTYMAAGLAVLASDLPGIASIVRRHDNGMLVSGSAPEAWAAAMDELSALPPSAIDRMKRHSLEAAESYSWARQAGEFIGEFARALQSRAP